MKDPSQFIPGQIDTDPAYPWGKARNDTEPSTGVGTPIVTAEFTNDLFALQQGLLLRAGMRPDNVADTALVSQQIQAMQRLFGAAALNFLPYHGVMTQAVRDVVWDPVAKQWLFIYTSTNTFAAARGSFADNIAGGAVQIASGVWGRSTNTANRGSGSNGSIVLITRTDGNVRRGDFAGGFSDATTPPSAAVGSPIYAYTLGRWVATGNDAAWYSTDEGDTWIPATTPPGLGAIPSPKMATDGTRVVCYGGSGVSYSDDGGDTWTDVAVTLSGGGIAYDPATGLWAIGHGGGTDNPAPVLTSGDGASWAAVGQIENPGGQLIVADVGFMGGYLLVSAGNLTSVSGRLWASDDLGVTFREVGPCLFPQTGSGSGFGWIQGATPWSPPMYFTGSQLVSTPWNNTLVTSLRGAI